ncbi:hypothetical protein E3N88_00935 [Mikania micrantha]|uniref:Uncharacterized protein n=1 Tax=Mikania micrantha TaxID=192012 RepID=A0A5N6PZK3_9ASTR|nr:hypothetical protein E3N88_00935 [Mikania micrantha]
MIFERHRPRSSRKCDNEGPAAVGQNLSTAVRKTVYDYDVGDYAYDNMVYLWGHPTFYSVVKGSWNGDLKAPANGCELSGRCKDSSPNDPAGLWEWQAAWVGQICRGGLFRQIEMWADWCCKGPAVVYTLWPFDQAWMCRWGNFWYG